MKPLAPVISTVPWMDRSPMGLASAPSRGARQARAVAGVEARGPMRYLVGLRCPSRGSPPMFAKSRLTDVRGDRAGARGAALQDDGLRPHRVHHGHGGAARAERRRLPLARRRARALHGSQLSEDGRHRRRRPRRAGRRALLLPGRAEHRRPAGVLRRQLRLRRRRRLGFGQERDLATSGAGWTGIGGCGGCGCSGGGCDQGGGVGFGGASVVTASSGGTGGRRRRGLRVVQRVAPGRAAAPLRERAGPRARLDRLRVRGMQAGACRRRPTAAPISAQGASPSNACLCCLMGSCPGPLSSCGQN